MNPLVIRHSPSVGLLDSDRLTRIPPALSGLPPPSPTAIPESPLLPHSRAIGSGWCWGDGLGQTAAPWAALGMATGRRARRVDVQSYRHSKGNHFPFRILFRTWCLNCSGLLGFFPLCLWLLQCRQAATMLESDELAPSLWAIRCSPVHLRRRA